MSAKSRSAALAQAIAAALPPLPLPIPSAQPSATKNNTAQQISPQNSKSNPPPSSILNPPSSHSHKPLRPRQLSAARLLLAGHSVSAAAAALRIHPYTLSRWKRNPAFQSELRRQTDALARNPAQQKRTARHTFDPFWKNEPTRQPGTPTPQHAK